MSRIVRIHEYGDASVLRIEDVAVPAPAADEVQIAVKAIGINRAEVMFRNHAYLQEAEFPSRLGYEAAGTVVTVGADVTGFKVGDEVFYAGAIDRPGTNSEYHLVDERIVGHKPTSLDWAQAAALPLTSVTAWETLFDRLDVRKPVPGAANAILIIGGAGGVGSITIQLARQLTDLTVIATASRDETRGWVENLGAHHVIDHRKPLAAQVEALGLGAPGFVFSTTHTDEHIAEIGELLAPQGRLALIDDPKTLDIVPLKQKSISVHWELMYTRSLFQTADMGEQGKLLDEVARLVDAGTIRTTLAENFGTIDAANLRKAHKRIESHTAKGKIVLEGF